MYEIYLKSEKTDCDSTECGNLKKLIVTVQSVEYRI